MLWISIRDASIGEKYLHKINIDQTTDDQAATPLYMAAQEGHNEVVELLLKNNASVDKAMGNSSVDQMRDRLS
ncbi:MAG: ankyrin repeat domain-containing protein [Oligoflexia bacterium]|nr:ankyrin repeat domain-containing protein [Oligoflexia bacterium]